MLNAEPARTSWDSRTAPQPVWCAMCPMAAETMALSSAIAADAGAPRAPAFVLRPEGDAAALGRIASACDEPLYALAKRPLDLVCAAVLLVAVLTVFALVGIAIVLERRGPGF